MAPSSIVLSWTFMTQSIDDAFVALGKNLKPLGIGLKTNGATTKVVGLGLPGFSDIYAGALAIPYYLSKEKPLSGYWQTASGGEVTRYNPLPAATAPLQIPVLMTVPNASSGQSKPANGWPVVIFQHGITRNRLDIFTLADALSFAGFATVAIDQPLHGVTDTTSPFYIKGLERTFDLDLVNNTTGAPTACTEMLANFETLNAALPTFMDAAVNYARQCQPPGRADAMRTEFSRRVNTARAQHEKVRRACVNGSYRLSRTDQHSALTACKWQLSAL